MKNVAILWKGVQLMKITLENESGSFSIDKPDLIEANWTELLEEFYGVLLSAGYVLDREDLGLG